MNALHLKYIKNKQDILNCNNISQYYCLLLVSFKSSFRSSFFQRLFSEKKKSIIAKKVSFQLKLFADTIFPILLSKAVTFVQF